VLGLLGHEARLVIGGGVGHGGGSFRPAILSLLACMRLLVQRRAFYLSGIMTESWQKRNLPFGG
jgi:hypothetical protein